MSTHYTCRPIDQTPNGKIFLSSWHFPLKKSKVAQFFREFIQVKLEWVDTISGRYLSRAVTAWHMIQAANGQGHAHVQTSTPLPLRASYYFTTIQYSGAVYSTKPTREDAVRFMSQTRNCFYNCLYDLK